MKIRDLTIGCLYLYGQVYFYLFYSSDANLFFTYLTLRFLLLFLCYYSPYIYTDIFYFISNFLYYYSLIHISYKVFVLTYRYTNKNYSSWIKFFLNLLFNNTRTYFNLCLFVITYHRVTLMWDKYYYDLLIM